VKNRALNLFQFYHFEFSRGLRLSYISPQPGPVVFAGGVQALNAFFHHSGWQPSQVR